MHKFFSKRVLIIAAITLAAIASGLILLFKVVLPDYMTPLFLHRTIVNGDAEVTDWRNVFPRREIANDAMAISTLPSGDTNASKAVARILGADVQTFLRDTDTSSLLIAKNNQLLLEAYAPGNGEGAIQTSMSVAKSFVSALTGIAIAEGYIASVDDSVVRYLPELKGRISDQMTIKHLLTMRAGNTYDGQGGLTGDDTIAYWSPDIRAIIRKYFTSAETPGTHMNYNDFQAQVLGMILEKATGMSVSLYLQEKIWKPAGMEYPASWSLDSKKAGFEQTAIGLNASSRDFVRFGLLYLNKGAWNGRQIVPKEWVEESTNADGGYGYYWWISPQNNGARDYSARGNHGQLIYVSPSTSTVIVRTGKSTGGVGWLGMAERLAHGLAESR